MARLDELAFLQVHYDDGEFEALESDVQEDIPSGYQNREFAENAVTRLFRTSGYHVGNIDQRWKSPVRHALGVDGFYSESGSETSVPSSVAEDLRATIRENVPSMGAEDPLDTIDINGIPDLLMVDEDDSSTYFFAEVKHGHERLAEIQTQWFDEFDFFDIRLVIVFDDEATRREFARNHDLEAILSKATARETFEDMDDRYEMGPGEIADLLATVEPGDRLLFNDRKEPLTVVDTDSTVTGKATLSGVELESGRGKTYLLSEDGDYYLDPWNKRELNWIGITH